MNGYDVEAQVEFEIGRLKVELSELRNTAVLKENANKHSMKIIELYAMIVDVYELRLAQLEDKIKDYKNEVTEY